MSAPLPAAWLASATALATRLGRDFDLRELELWEQVQLSVWQARGVTSVTAGLWLALPEPQQLRAQAKRQEAAAPEAGGAA